MRSSVVLPAPFGPARATRSRRSTLNDTLSKRRLPPSSFRMPDAMTTAMPIRLEAVSRRLGITKALLVASVLLLILVVTEFLALLQGDTVVGLAAVTVTGVLLSLYTAF